MTFRTPFLCAALLVAAAEASAQATDSSFATPTCAEQGIARVAMMIPPGSSEQAARELAGGGTLFPQGTRVVLLKTGQLTPLLNEQEFHDRMIGTLDAFASRGTKIEGTTSTLLVLDETGAVVEAYPGTRNRPVDQTLERTWKRARFEPYEFGGCRVRAYVYVPLSFSSDYSLTERRIHLKVADPR